MSLLPILYEKVGETFILGITILGLKPKPGPIEGGTFALHKGQLINGKEALF